MEELDHLDRELAGIAWQGEVDLDWLLKLLEDRLLLVSRLSGEARQRPDPEIQARLRAAHAFGQELATDLVMYRRHLASQLLRVRRVAPVPVEVPGELSVAG